MMRPMIKDTENHLFLNKYYRQIFKELSLIEFIKKYFKNNILI